MALERINSIESFEIPRPKCVGMEFVPIRGRYGYYQTVNKSVAIKYGLSQQQTEQQKRRPKLPNDWGALAGDEKAAEEKRNQRKTGDSGGKGRRDGRDTRHRAPTQGSAAEPTPDYDQREMGVCRFAFSDGRSPAAPPLSLILRQSLLAKQSKLCQETEKNRSFNGTAGETNAFMASTFRDEQHPKKIVTCGGDGATSAKAVADVRL